MDANTPLSDLVSLRGRCAAVTGAAMGIGYGIAHRLAEAGAVVLLADSDAEAAMTAAKGLREAGFQAIGVRCDVTDERDVHEMVLDAAHDHGGVDILVNNAGIYPNVSILGMDGAQFRRALEVNLLGPFLCTKLVAADMIRRGRGGRIINVTSVDALHPSAVGLAHYDASKHGLWGFTKNVALELAPHRIWVNAIAPGAVATPGVIVAQVCGDAGPDDPVKAFLAKVPAGRIGDPDDIGRVAVFLASDLASYMTGTQIVVDGGFLLG